MLTVERNSCLSNVSVQSSVPVNSAKMTSNLSCTICSENYKNTDEVYSTSCGHLFHFHCMQAWQSRQSSCPQCRGHNPQIHKVYLHLDESAEDEQKLLQLKSQVEQHLKVNSELQFQLEESEKNFMQLQVQFHNNEEYSKELNSKIEMLTAQIESRNENVATTLSNLEHQLGHSDQNFMNLQQQFDWSEEKLKERDAEITHLSNQNENRERVIARQAAEIEKLRAKIDQIETCGADIMNREKNQDSVDRLNLVSEELQKELTLKTAEIEKLRAQIDQIEARGVDLKYREKNKVLEERLKLVSQELQKEIRNSTTLTVDKMKLESILAQYTSAASLALPTNRQHGAQKQGEPMKRQEVLKKDNVTVMENKHVNSQKASEMDLGITSVVIKGITDNESKMSLIFYVLKLAQQMEMECSKDDIENVFILDKNIQVRNQIAPLKLSLLVKFRTLEKKVLFLSKKDKLRNYPETQRLILYEYVTENVNSLFHHAKVLRNYGYKSVYCRNNSVVVKKTNTSPVIVIRNKQQVDEIVMSAMNERTDSQPKRNEIGSKPACDAQFYALE